MSPEEWGRLPDLLPKFRPLLWGNLIAQLFPQMPEDQAIGKTIPQGWEDLVDSSWILPSRLITVPSFSAKDAAGQTTRAMFAVSVR